MMKKQIAPAGFGKKLSRKEMKDIQGGVGSTTGSTWVCTADNFDCFSTRALCQAACSRPSACRTFGACP